MSYLLLTRSADPSTPAADKAEIFIESANRRPIVLSDHGIRHVLSGHEPSNFLRNSGFWFAQRQAPGTATTYNATAARLTTADGWSIMNQNASATYQRTDTMAAPETGLQSRYYGNYLKITSTGKVACIQHVEARDVANMRGRTMRFQCKMKQLVGAAPIMRMFVAQLVAAGSEDSPPGTYFTAFGANTVDPTLGTNMSYIAPKAGITPENGAISGNGVSVTLSAAWQRFGGVWDIPTDCKGIAVICCGDSQFAATNGFAIGEASLTDGYEIQDWNPLSYMAELDRCLRFYEKSFFVDTLPAQNNGAGSGESYGIAGKATAVANAGFIPVTYKVEKHSPIALVTVFNPAAANALMRNITGAADMGATAIQQSTVKGFVANATGVAATAVGDEVAIHWTADAEF